MYILAGKFQQEYSLSVGIFVSEDRETSGLEFLIIVLQQLLRELCGILVIALQQLLQDFVEF